MWSVATIAGIGTQGAGPDAGGGMTYRSWRILTIMTFICLACAVQAHRQRGLGDISFAVDIIEQNYVEPVTRNALYKAAIEGIANSLDPFTGYIPAEEFGPFQAQLQQEFGGLGIIVEKPSDQDPLQIVMTLYDSPAAKSGLKAGDRIDRIDNEDAKSMSIDDARKLLRGPAGSEVLITVIRDGENDLRKIRVRRAIIETESVTGDRRNPDGRWEFMMEANSKIAYIRVEIFGEKTTTELQNALQAVAPVAEGLILDLRDNAGGLLPTAISLCDMFLDDGVIVSTVGRGGVLESIRKATPGVELKKTIPMVVLINHESASASEVTAACLQDHGRAIIVGERSYGKGSVQNVVHIEGGQAALRLTTAYYYPPQGKNIHRRKDAKDTDEWGVMPDAGFEVKMEAEQTKAAFQRLRSRSTPAKVSLPDAEVSATPTDQSLTKDIPSADPTIYLDPQLTKALGCLLQKLQ